MVLLIVMMSLLLLLLFADKLLVIMVPLNELFALTAVIEFIFSIVLF